MMVKQPAERNGQAASDTSPLQSAKAARIVAESLFDHHRRNAFLAPHHTHHAIFLGLILVAIRIYYRSSRLIIHFGI
jgi:hypothetical protein